ncbi:MAG: hypothetical protein EA376_00685 [Phycisphaeraceae bacterium]|nr:MAG: hypothetical protein EA376_00685 [Phycisphaeraceae bacterium]
MSVALEIVIASFAAVGVAMLIHAPERGPSATARALLRVVIVWLAPVTGREREDGDPTVDYLLACPICLSVWTGVMVCAVEMACGGSWRSIWIPPLAALIAAVISTPRQLGCGARRK